MAMISHTKLNFRFGLRQTSRHPERERALAFGAVRELE